MSQHKNTEVRDLLRSLQGLSEEELEEENSLILNKDGTVHDILDDVTYDCIETWAEAQCGEKDERFYGGGEYFQ